MLKWFSILYGLLSGFMVLGLSRLSREGADIPDEDLPVISVVVAARNEAANLPNLIEALKKQQYPDDKVSFWIVDDESEDETLAIAREAEKADSRFHVLSTDTSSLIRSPKKRALDTAIRQTQSEWIVTTDADCLPNPGWLAALAKFMKPGIGAVVGYAPLVGGRNPVEWLAEGESWSAAALAASGIGLGFPFNAMGRNFAFRRKVYIDLGGYGFGGKMASGDDDLFLQHIASRTNWKVKFAFDPDAIVPSQVPNRKVLLGTKARHMSAGPQYAPGWVVIGAVGSTLFMGLALATVAGFLGKANWKTVGKAWRTKWLLDCFMIGVGLRILGDPKRGLQALAAMTAAPFALWAIWPKALFGTVVWKGRRFARGKVPGG